MEKRRKRAVILKILGLVLFIALAARLYYIQIMCQEELTEGARSQQVIKVQTAGGRGTIYDRNMIRLTDSCLHYYYLIEKEMNTVGLEKLLNSIEAEPAGYKGDDYIVYRSEHFDKEINHRLIEEYGAYSFCGGSRYSENQLAAHLIGYVSGEKKIGTSGLEKMYQYRLAAEPASLLMTGNGIGQPVAGIGVTEKDDREVISPSAVITTIDAGLQKKVEEILREREISGAAVVLQASTGQVLAMASAPTFSPDRVSEYLNSENGELVNKAAQGQYPPGSVFKIAAAAAALESGSVDLSESYTCSGSTEVNGVTLACDDHPEGHGKVTFEEAFAQSCNGFFAHLAKKTGSETIVDMAQRMGLGAAVIDGFPDEEQGAFPAKEDRIYSGLANLSIGQGSLLTTPLQVAKMTNIIACRGIDHDISVTLGEAAADSGGRRVMNETTALQVGRMMEKVCEEGTASGAELHVRAAGKTGSAEAGDRGRYTVHGWFTGYFPADSPEYTVTVLAENGKTGSGSALPVFEEIVNYLY